MRTALVILGLFAVGLAGCVADDPTAGTTGATDVARDILPGIPLDELDYVTEDPLAAHTDAGHDHADPAQHQGAHNVVSYGHAPPEEGQRLTEIDVVGDFVYQCSGSGFRILDITNRSAPQVVSVYSGEQTCADVKVTADGAYAIVMGVEIVDVTDKTSPEVVVADTGAFCHMCYIHEIDGREYVFLARDEPHEVPFGNGVGIYELTRDPVGLERVGAFVVAPEDRVNTHMPDGDVFAHQVHDMLVYDDPVLGKPVMLAAYWDLGVRIVDVSDPAGPVEIGAWDDFNGDLGDIHTVGVDFIDDRRIIAAGTENGAIIDPVGSASGYSAGFVYLLDATDPADVRTLGKWINPGRHASGPEPVGVYSMHNLQFVQGRVYAAHYHAGVWVIDAAGYVQAAAEDPLRTALREDEVPSWGFVFTSTDDASPNVWDVVLKDGYLYASDIGNGLHTLRFVGDPLGDPAFTSIG